MIAGIPSSELLWLAAALLAAGALTGLLAGVFGVGGGAVIVPVLFELFRIAGVPAERGRDAEAVQFATSRRVR